MLQWGWDSLGSGSIFRIISGTSMLRSALQQGLQESASLSQCHLRRCCQAQDVFPEGWNLTFQACFPLSFSHGRNLGVRPFPWLVDPGLAWGPHALTSDWAAHHVRVWRWGAPVLSRSLPLYVGTLCVCIVCAGARVHRYAWVWCGCHISDAVHLVFWDWVTPWLRTHQLGHTGVLDISCLCRGNTGIANVYHCAWLFFKKWVLENQT